MKTNNEPLTIQLYTPHKGQQRLHNSTARFRVMATGRRWGKTMSCCNEVAKHVLEHNGHVALWVAPTYKATTIAFRMLSKALKEVLAAPPNKSELHLELINGSEINFASAERYDNIRGIGVHFLVIDECAFVPEAAWTEVLRPCLSDTNGRAIMIGSPKGRGFFYKLFQKGLDPLEEEWESFTFKTEENPFIPAKEIASARRDLPEEIFAQEYDAKFLEDNAVVFKNVDGCTQGDVCDPVLGETYTIGFDPARFDDYSVVTVLNMTTRHVDYFERFSHMEWEDQLDAVEGIAKRYNHAIVEMDGTGIGNPVSEQLRKREVIVNDIKFNNTNKEQYVRNLRLLLENTQVTFPPIQSLIQELKDFEYHYTESRNIVYSAPSGGHDDCVTSLMLVAWKVQKSGDIPLLASVVVVQEVPIPSVQELDDARLMERQRAVERSLRYVYSFLALQEYP